MGILKDCLILGPTKKQVPIERKQSQPARYLSVDEKAFRKGYDYVTVFCDLIIALERKACGDRNRDHFKAVIYFFCGGLDFYPGNSSQGYPRETRKDQS
jgi:hypothetical protein